ncbi:MAG: GNAT family N-acetyltransferase [Alphaproteobacteria bacterium]|jgi:8-oxo-dGTP diphosphatase|nr:GNAT family N-acetyltransferase [Alphaproteobacteria bacterium]
MAIPERLETRRLLLRRHRPEDAPALVRALDNWAVVKWLAEVPLPYTLEQALDWIALTRTAWQQGRDYQLLITLKPGGTVIGQIGLRVDTPFEPVERSAELGYWLAEADWGHGYGPEAAGAMVDFGFRRLGLDRIRATCLPDNHRSLTVLTGLGLRPAGKTWLHFVARGATLEVLELSLDRATWRASMRADTAPADPV